MKLIKTKSFELAVITRGNENSKRLVIALPGRLDTKDYACFPRHLEYLANKGFFSVSFDPPGTWESPGPIELFTTTNYIKAVNELIEYFGNKPTFLIGHSRGGTVAILAGASNSNVIGFAPIMATFGPADAPTPEDLQTGSKISYRDLPPGNKKTNEQKKFVLPINFFKDSEQYDVLSVLKNSTKPKLLIYGTRDEFTTPERAKEVFKAILEPKMTHELDTDHDYRYHPAIIDEVNKVLGQFLDKYLV